jgi:hypothetical protein
MRKLAVLVAILVSFLVGGCVMWIPGPRGYGHVGAPMHHPRPPVIGVR